MSDQEDLDNIPRSDEPSFIDWFAAKYPATMQEMRMQYKIHIVSLRRAKVNKFRESRDSTKRSRQA